MRRLSLGIAGVLVAAASFWIITATPGRAFAAPTATNASSVQIGWTDSAIPDQAFDLNNGARLPLGSHADSDGTVHTSRIYATYDLSPYLDQHFVSASMFVTEVSAADCSVRAIEVWNTKVVTQTPTWADPPKEVTKQDEILTPEFCPNAFISFDVSAAVSGALASHKDRVTFELRVPAADELNPSFGRELSGFASVRLNVKSNFVPTVDNSSLTNGGFRCGSADEPIPLGAFAQTLQALFDDRDTNDQLTATFTVWPVTDPTAVTTTTSQTAGHGSFSTGRIPDGVLVDGTTYAWHANATDGLDTSPWSKTCYFLYDGSRPPAPTITSTNYPTDGHTLAPAGELGHFEFSAAGQADVIGFEYSWGTLPVHGCTVGAGGQLMCPDPLSGPNVVKLEPGETTASVKLSPPRSFINTLAVVSIDRAGNTSPQKTLRINVPSTSPDVRIVGGAPQWNTQVTVAITPSTKVSNVASYQYDLGDGSGPASVPANADGTGTLTFLASNVGGYQIRVRSVSHNGFVSTEGFANITFLPWAGVTSDVYLDDGFGHGGIGVPGNFTFTPPPGFLAVASYQYVLPNGEDVLTVQARPDNTATITFAPDTSGAQSMSVWAVAPDGTISDNANVYSFVVADGSG